MSNANALSRLAALVRRMNQHLQTHVGTVPPDLSKELDAIETSDDDGIAAAVAPLERRIEALEKQMMELRPAQKPAEQKQPPQAEQKPSPPAGPPNPKPQAPG